MAAGTPAPLLICHRGPPVWPITGLHAAPKTNGSSEAERSLRQVLQGSELLQLCRPTGIGQPACELLQSRQRTRSSEKPVAPPLPAPQKAFQLPREPKTVAASGQVHLVVLGPASQDPAAAATVCLTPLPLLPATAGLRPRVPAQHRSAAQHPQSGLGAVLGALQRRVQRLQQRQERHQAQLRDLEQLAQQLCKENLQARLHRVPLCMLPRPEESQTFTIICGGSDIAVVLAQGPASPTPDVKPELLEAQTPST
ncbi:PREDICTED: THAP domain-containing protein 8 [Chinchilla lanigera]|uniref:THAP domain-containing protein 8 n=1 Tax=Chinchilla lanigera TaxID=34839 RepID=UPI0006963C82|nr:PREDICTED: THAP domain-containing protein 8 [Chinchilla lanigera]